MSWGLNRYTQGIAGGRDEVSSRGNSVEFVKGVNVAELFDMASEFGSVKAANGNGDVMDKFVIFRGTDNRPLIYNGIIQFVSCE